MIIITTHTDHTIHIYMVNSNKVKKIIVIEVGFGCYFEYWVNKNVRLWKPSTEIELEMEFNSGIGLQVKLVFKPYTFLNFSCTILIDTAGLSASIFFFFLLCFGYAFWCGGLFFGSCNIFIVLFVSLPGYMPCERLVTDLFF